MMSDFRGGEGFKMTPKNRNIEDKNRIKGRGIKNESKNRTSFMHDPLSKILLRIFLFITRISTHELERT